MELKMRNGKVVWVKSDGSPSSKPVSMKNELQFHGFPEVLGPGRGRCNSVTVLEGDPAKDEIILVKASGTSWWGTYLVSKRSRDYEKVREAELEYAKLLIEKPPRTKYSLPQIMEDWRQGKRDAVDIELLANIKGLNVWEAQSFSGYWCREYGEFNDIPEGWDFLAKGDAAYTQRVRKGPHWILKRKRKTYTVELGTLAPSKTIDRAFSELGGEEVAAHRQRRKEIGQVKREQIVTEQLRSAIQRCFPSIPKEDLLQVLKRARSDGRVGRMSDLYFTKKEYITEHFDRASYLAVRAHVRHQYTNYDELLPNPHSIGGPNNDLRAIVRREVADEIKRVLEMWESNTSSSNMRNP